ncbi:hypothetical protein AB0C21_24115 [Spirillospora sp. NPDC049024]
MFIVAHVGALLAVASAGCGSMGGEPAMPGPVATPTPTSMAQLQFPLDAYAPSLVQNAQEGRLASHLANLCLRRYGLPPLSSVNFSESIEQSVRTQRYNQTRRYGLTDRKTAEQYGYGTPKWTEGDTKPQSLDDVPSDILLVLRGSPRGASEAHFRGKPVPPGGCSGEAKKIIGFDGDGSHLAEELQATTFQRMQNEPRAQAALAQWSQCIKRKGYNYTDPWNAGNGFGAEDGESGPPTTAEIKSAVASVDCSYAVNLPGALFAVEADLQNVEIEKNAEALEKEKKRVESRARHIQSLVRKYGG